MNTSIFPLEVITPCFCGGANPEKEAEIRAPSIRGQLRWWFRVLGGFKSMAGKTVREQEDFIFGAANGNSGQASKLVVRVKAVESSKIRANTAFLADDMGASQGTGKGYFLFPLRKNPRGCFDYGNLPKFDLIIQWRDESRHWDSIQALIHIFGSLGSLGFRSRRAMGALAFRGQVPSVSQALAYFQKPSSIVVKQLPASGAENAIQKLAGWLKGWRSHGRSEDLERNPERGAGFRYAKNDHDAGYNAGITTTYRPALGLPIIQRYTSRGQTVNWDYGMGGRNAPKGRFASPVILRPFRSPANQWLALIIFVDANRWPAGQAVYLDGARRNVSPDLYDAMKADPDLASHS